MNNKKTGLSLESKDLSMSINDIERSSLVMKALGSPDRLRIVALLGAGSMNVQQIARAAGLPLTTAGAHVRMLEDAAS